MLPCAVAGLGIGRLEYRARYPPVPLVEVRIGPLIKRETAVLRLERRLQVRGIVNGVRPRVAGQQLERVGEALLHVHRQSMVDRTSIRELRVHAVEGHRHAKPGGVSREPSELHLCRITAGQGARKGWIGSRRPEEVEE